MRKDLTHRVVLADDGVPQCRDCGTVLPADQAVIAVAMDGVLVDVGGLGAAFYPADPDEVGADVLKCTHPSAAKQATDILVQECESCGGTGGRAGTCERCKGSGMLAFLPDGSGGYKLLTVSGEKLREYQQEGEVKPASRSTDEERMVRRGAFQNWMAMREATRPEGLTEAS